MPVAAGAGEGAGGAVPWLKRNGYLFNLSGVLFGCALIVLMVLWKGEPWGIVGMAGLVALNAIIAVKTKPGKERP